MKINFLLLIIALAWGSAAHAQPPSITSQYTSLQSPPCKTQSSNEMGSVLRCPGVAGYQLWVYKDDNRQSVSVVHPHGSKSDLDFYYTITGSPSFLGKKAEWRLKRVNGELKPIALIIPVNARESTAHPKKVTSYLSVSKITPLFTCVVGKVGAVPRKNQNLIARQVADQSGGKSCIPHPGKKPHPSKKIVK